ncbi:MAG: mechanosensitive ion channel family protein [Clostridiales bacterium]|jgi:small conductance mechanosensitive channel|nr:mechanosensitive ion channel family protein [Clostridiales bacterium]MCI1961887.1 mechanosensitive ion channel family protein [Clostridiales bacterium]MCI2022380.1 mechanosensitive ion channel family protein [Clostridiales bacterium]MCI2026777.1 mechanosensitive ion channel family protein [Clostridiales bacterium]
MPAQTMWQDFLLWLQGALPRLIGALLIFAIGWKLSDWMIQIGKRMLNRTGVEIGFVTFVGSLLKILLKVIVVIAVLDQLNVNVSAIVAAVGAAGVTAALALKDNLSNVACGAQIILTKPFKVGDYIAMDSTEGTVMRIEMMFTVLKTFDNREVVIPNSTLTAAVITNYTAMENRMLDLTYGISYQDDLLAAKAVLQKLAEENPKILKEPAPMVVVREHGSSAVLLLLRVWCKTTDYWSLYYEMQEQVKLAFDRAGLTIPFDQVDVHLKDEIKEHHPDK